MLLLRVSDNGVMVVTFRIAVWCRIICFWDGFDLLNLDWFNGYGVAVRVSIYLQRLMAEV